MISHSSDFQFSPLIVGTMRLGAWGADMSQHALEVFIQACIDMGLRDFDHADIYGHYTEEGRFGRVLRDHPGLRHRLQLTTKCGIRLVCKERPENRIHAYDLTREYIIHSAERSLQALHTDYIDLLLLHRPDYLMHPQEIAAAFDHLRQSGKVLHFGVSNFTPTQMDMVASFTPIINNQVEISLLRLDAFTDGTLDKCQQLGIQPTAWSPLGGGNILDRTTDPRVHRILTTAGTLSKKLDISIDQVLFAWIMKHPARIVPVLGTTRIDRIRTALAATRITLDREDWYDLWQASTGVEIP